MTKYILHGGKPQNGTYQQDFYDEIIQDVPERQVTLLYVPFAKDQSRWEEKLTDLKDAFKKAAPQKDIMFVLANPEPETLVQQMKQADIIFLAGGDNIRLKEKLQELPYLKQPFEGKTIVAVSAGACVLSAAYYSNDTHQIEEGLTVLPIKVFCHYTEDKEPQLVELEQYKDQLTSFALPEDFFVTIK